jgi:hypothetical protein
MVVAIRLVTVAIVFEKLSCIGHCCLLLLIGEFQSRFGKKWGTGYRTLNWKFAFSGTG